MLLKEKHPHQDRRARRREGEGRHRGPLRQAHSQARHGERGRDRETPGVNLNLDKVFIGAVQVSALNRNRA